MFHFNIFKEFFVLTELGKLSKFAKLPTQLEFQNNSTDAITQSNFSEFTNHFSRIQF